MDGSRLQLRTAALAAAGAIALFAGCGEGEPTAAEFSGEVNAACRQAAVSVEQSAAAGAESAGRSRVARLNRLLARLDEIDPPADLEARYAQYKDAMKGFALVARLAAAGGAREALGAAHEQVARAQRTLLATARELRLGDCV